MNNHYEMYINTIYNTLYTKTPFWRIRISKQDIVDISDLEDGTVRFRISNGKEFFIFRYANRHYVDSCEKVRNLELDLSVVVLPNIDMESVESQYYYVVKIE